MYEAGVLPIFRSVTRTKQERKIYNSVSTEVGQLIPHNKYLYVSHDAYFSPHKFQNSWISRKLSSDILQQQESQAQIDSRAEEGKALVQY